MIQITYVLHTSGLIHLEEAIDRAAKVMREEKSPTSHQVRMIREN